jgi:hypothetical protein
VLSIEINSRFLTGPLALFGMTRVVVGMTRVVVGMTRAVVGMTRAVE